MLDDYYQQRCIEIKGVITKFHEGLDKIGKAILNKDYLGVQKILTDLLLNSTEINSTILLYGIRKDQKKGKIDVNKNNMPLPILKEIIDNYLSLIRYCKYKNNFDNLEIISKFNNLLLKNYIKFAELQIAFIGYMSSPDFIETKKEVILEIYELFQELLCNSNINGAYFNYDQSCVYKGQETRGSENKTTLLQLTFSLDNSNAYSLRLDLAHKGNTIKLSTYGIF